MAHRGITFLALTAALAACGHPETSDTGGPADADVAEQPTQDAAQDGCIVTHGADAGDAAHVAADASLDAGRDASVDASVDASTPDAQVPPDPPRCEPTGGGPFWLNERETVEVQLRCATGESLDPSEFDVAPLPRGAMYDRSTATLRWTPDIDQAAVYVLRVAVPSLREQGTLTIGVADRFWDADNVPVVDPASYTSEFGVPAIFVSYTGEVTKDVPIPAEVVYRGHRYTTTVKYHGSTSLEYPKKSYGLKFSDSDLFNDPDHAGGFLNRDKIRLSTTFDDNTYVRQRLGYALWALLDPANIEIKSYNVVVFLNGAYQGLYLLSDDVDKGLLRIEGLNKDGNLYKAVTNDCDFTLEMRSVPNTPKPTPHEGFEKKEGLPPQGTVGAFDDLDAFITFVATASDADFSARFPAMTRLQDFQGFWMFVSALRAGDNTRKNYYLYRDPACGPWRYAPWDLNATFGQKWDTARATPEVNEFERDDYLFSRMLADPAMGLRARYGQVLRGEWRLTKVLALFDAYTSEIDGAARRDEIMWAEKYRTYSVWRYRTDFLDFAGECQYVRGWITDHWNAMRARYP